ncbi:MAG: LysE family transporter [Ignavibacteriales bacterium]|nr:LysE family transporter [Ignavibacteriales bacterium]
MISLLEGLVIGFALAVPIGPAGILCIRQTLSFGGRDGFLIGLSAASADIIYGAVAAFGATFISDFVTVEQHWMRLATGLLLLVLGVRVYRSSSAVPAHIKGRANHAGMFASAFALTITNPLTLFGYLAVFSALGVPQTVESRMTVILLVVGVFVGSLLWFSMLAALVLFFKEKASVNGLATVNKVAGSLLVLCGMVALWAGLRGFHNPPP